MFVGWKAIHVWHAAGGRACDRTLPLADRGNAVDALLLGALHDGDSRQALRGIHEHAAAADRDIVWQQVERDVAGRRELRSTQKPHQRLPSYAVAG